MLTSLVFIGCGALWMLSSLSKSKGVLLKAVGKPSLKYSLIGISGKVLALACLLLAIWFLKKILLFNLMLFVASFFVVLIGFFIFKKKLFPKKQIQFQKK